VRLGDHPEQGDNAEVAAIVFAVAAAVLYGVDRWGQRLPALGPLFARWLAPATYAATAALGVIALGTMIIAGHSGAALVWKDVGNFVSAK
jgi:hypothetical protein